MTSAEYMWLWRRGFRVGKRGPKRSAFTRLCDRCRADEMVAFKSCVECNKKMKQRWAKAYAIRRNKIRRERYAQNPLEYAGISE